MKSKRNKVIVINGSGGVGKDYLVNYVSRVGSDIFGETSKSKSSCIDNGLLFTTLNFSTIDKVKTAASCLGWGGGKSDAERKFLSDLKYLSTEFNNFPFNDVKLRIERIINKQIEQPFNLSLSKLVFFVHTREPNEIRRFRDLYSYNEGYLDSVEFSTLLVSNKGLQVPDNEADMGVGDYRYDYCIENKGDETFKLLIDDFIESVINN